MKNIFLFLLLLMSVGIYAQSPINLKTQTNISDYIGDELEGRLVDTLSSLSDTTTAVNEIGRIVHVVDIDQKWTVNSAGNWEVLSGGTDDQTAAEVTTIALDYERNTVANVQQGLADIDSNLIELSGIVNIPQEIGITLPFSIYKTSRDTSATYTITKDFSLQDFATCPAVDTLYVDPSTGNDTNDGQSFSTPLFSIDKAIELINTSGQCHHVELKEGEVFSAESGWENIVANVEFSMNCNNSLIHDDQQHLLGAWSAVFNYHQAALNETIVSGVVDTTQTNSFGEFLALTEVSSTAEVNTTNNSWYQDGTNIYVNTNSNTAPDGRIIISGGSAYEWDIQASAGSFYIKNARTEGVTIRTRNSGGRYTLAIDSSEMTRPSGSLIWGIDSYFFNSSFHGGTGDLINLDVESGYIAKHVDYNNTYYHNTEDNTADACGNCQLSTGHQDTRLVQINTTFGIVPNGAGVQRDNVTGQPVAHVTGSKFLMVGCDIGGSQTNGLTLNINVEAWIEGTNARLQDNGNDLQVDAGCIAFLKGNYFPTISNSGTISNYYYNPATKKIQPYQIEGITGIDRDTALAGGANRIPTSDAISGKIENTKNALQSAIEAVLPTGVQGQSVFFNASDELAASNFLYHDQINNRLGLNTTTPSAFFEAETGAGNVYFRFDAQTSGQDVGIQLNDGAGQSWTIGTNNTNNSGSLNITTLDGISSPTRLILARNGYLGLGLNNTQPSDRLEVVGSVNSSAGYKVAGAATSGNYLRGNGTNFVSSTIQESDLPDRPATDITATDAGGYFTGSDLEAITQELGARASGIDTLWDYTSLRAYTGSANAVYVNKPGLAGLFRRVASGTDNGGTVIVASNSVVWERDYQEGHIYVDWFGAVGDGVADDAPAINAAIDNLHVTDHYNFYFTPGKTYLLENSINDLNDNLPATFWGYGSTVKRADEVVTTTTTATASGATTIEVTDASAFSVGDQIILIDVTDTYGGTAENETSASNLSTVISDISGSTITVDQAIALPPSGNLSTEYPIGSKVLKIYDLFSVSQTAETNFFGLSFDGNAAGNTSYRGWIGNATISKLGDNSTVQDCYFTQSPCETIFTDSGVKILNNTADSIYGSLVHVSATNLGKTIISGNITNYTNLATQEVSRHAEAVYTCSVNTDTVIITNNIAQNGMEYLYGPHNSLDDHTVSVTGNLATNMGGAVWFVSDFSSIGSNAIISNNQFINCDELTISRGAQGSLADEAGHYGFLVQDNTFRNTRIAANSTHRLKISNNEMVFDSSYTNTKTGYESSAIYVGESGFFDITGNTIEQYDSLLHNAIVYNLITTFPSSSLDRYLTFTRFNISDNTLLNFQNGVNNTSLDDGSRAHSFGNSKISNNIIVNYTSTANNEPETTGIYAVPGVHVFDNILWGQPSTDVNPNSTLSIGIFMRGVDSLLQDSIMGPIVYDNTIYGFTESIEISQRRPTGLQFGYNCVAKDNYYSGFLDDNNEDPSNPNTVTGNIQIVDLPKNSLPHVFGGSACLGLINNKKYRDEILYAALLRAYVFDQRNRAR